MMQSKSDIIAQDIAAKIKHEQFKANSFLPSESELTKLYGTSRETVRKALQGLNSLGLIQKIRGKGSLVLNLEQYSFPISGISSFAELSKSLGMDAQTEVLTLEKMHTLPELFKKKFPNEKQQTGFYVERLRKINGNAEILDCDFLFSPPINELPLDAAQTSIYNYLENEKGLEVSYATKAITVEKVDDELQRKLSLKDKTAVLVASHNYLSDATLFQLTLSYHDPSKFKFVDFARRQRIRF
ncbi:trehalose operon repressor [Lactobacillus sp. ESL0731]|uniref:trehalose operon repressor n=1 Tax=unclassified Lactobacillus TaxID=2620435 RepID=UPI0023F7E879|nr:MULTISPECIES: trehalose operon repressor [unclassified Lactobacillus]WEV52042.1 trehalose operon repressor [Lactobacillus sp. ESL0700]WEV63170.1 trehalose operon repressor [Lactobacillus sp. ESL0731]